MFFFLLSHDCLQLLKSPQICKFLPDTVFGSGSIKINFELNIYKLCSYFAGDRETGNAGCNTCFNKMGRVRGTA